MNDDLADVLGRHGFRATGATETAVVWTKGPKTGRRWTALLERSSRMLTVSRVAKVAGGEVSGSVDTGTLTRDELDLWVHRLLAS